MERTGSGKYRLVEGVEKAMVIRLTFLAAELLSAASLDNHPPG